MNKLLSILLFMFISTDTFSSSDWTQQEMSSFYKGCINSSLENPGWTSENIDQLREYCSCVTMKVSRKYVAAQIYKDSSILSYELRQGGIYDVCLK